VLHPPDPNDPERILALGGPGTGKTKGWLSIADWSQKTKSPARFYVIDSDDSVTRMLAGKPKLSSVIEYRKVHQWEGYVDALNDFAPKLTDDDWLVVDFVGSSWDAVQEFYVEQIYGTDMGNFFLDARSKMKAGSPLDGWKDYGVINRIFRGWMNQLIHDTPGHKYLTAVADEIRDTDAKDIKARYSKVGVRPRGQKHLTHAVHTVMLMLEPSAKRYFYTTIKDRERVELVGHEVTKDFVLDYLVPVAGWKL
jgi:hypothetical protein